MSSPAAAWRYPCRPRARNEAPGIGLTTAPGVRSAPEAVIAFSTKTGTFDRQTLAQTTAEMRQARKPSNWCRTTRAYPSSWKWAIVCMAAKFFALGLWQFNGARGHDQPTVPRRGHGARALLQAGTSRLGAQHRFRGAMAGENRAGEIAGFRATGLAASHDEALTPRALDPRALA